MPIDEAINTYHAMALFGEKYGDKVRVVQDWRFLDRTLWRDAHSRYRRNWPDQDSEGRQRVFGGAEGGGDHGIGIASGISARITTRKRGVEFRLSHPCAKNAQGWGTRFRCRIPAEKTFSPAEALKAELEKKDSEIKRLTEELDQARMKSASSSTANLGEKIKEVKGVKVLAHRVDNLERAQLRTLVDQLRDKIGSGVVVLGSASDGNVALIVGVTKDLTGRVQAGKVIGPVAQKVGGKGGGRPDLAEAGGKDASALDAALDGAYGVVEGMLA